LQSRAFSFAAPERAACWLALCGVLTACSEQDRATDFASLAAPGGGSVLITTVVEPWFPQGPHQVVVYVQSGATAPRIEVARTELAYDGVPFTARNIGMRWTSDAEALVCLRATDRPDRSVYVDARQQPPTAELRDGC
jgi:hypothetical protein